MKIRAVLLIGPLARSAEHRDDVSALSQVKADVVQSRCRADMPAAVEPRAEHKDTAFAGRAAGGDHCWQAAVRLRQAKLRDFLGRRSNPPCEEIEGNHRTRSWRSMT